MSETQQILTLSRRALAREEELCLVTVVHVEGSSYRKPGARMLLTSGGERAGTISGGCLEAEVSRKAWWLTEKGPHVERYSSFAEEDGSLPYGLGCGGTVTLLLERGAAVLATLRALEQGFTEQHSCVLVTALEQAGEPGTVAIVVPVVGATGHADASSVSLKPLYLRRGATLAGLHTIVAQTFAERRSGYLADLERPAYAFPPFPGTQDAAALPAYFVEYLAPPPALTIFGAGDDAQPIAALAHSLGWRVTVADGRAHLARRERFPQAAAVRVLDWEQTLGQADAGLRAACGLNGEALAPEVGDGLNRLFMGGGPLLSDPLAIILTHSYIQDRALLAALLPRKLAYLGILGPRHRTERLLGEVTPGLGLAIDEAFARLHSPVGLDLGASDPASVALSILAEIQAVLHGRQLLVAREPGPCTVKVGSRGVPASEDGAAPEALDALAAVPHG